MLVVAALFGWYAIWLPLQEAREGAEIVRWSPRAGVILWLCIVFGVYLAVTGNRYQYRNIERQTLTPLGWLLIAVVAIGGLATFFYMDMSMHASGYR